MKPFSKENQPTERRKKDEARNILHRIGDEMIDVELQKGQGKVKISRKEAMIRALYQRASGAKGDAATQIILDRLYGKVKDKIEISGESRITGGVFADASKMSGVELMRADPDFAEYVRNMVKELPPVEEAEFQLIETEKTVFPQSVTAKTDKQLDIGTR